MPNGASSGITVKCYFKLNIDFLITLVRNSNLRAFEKYGPENKNPTAWVGKGHSIFNYHF